MQNVIVKGDKVTIRTIEESDIKTLWDLVFKEENPFHMNNWYLITKLYNIINDICFDFSEKIL